MPQHTEPIIFPWCRTSCACGCEIAVAAREGVSWVPEAGDPGTNHPDVEPCRHCHCLMLRPGCLTVSENRDERRFSPDLVDAQRRRN